MRARRRGAQPDLDSNSIITYQLTGRKFGGHDVWELLIICDPPYDFRDKGDNMLTTRFHLKTKEIYFNTLTKHARVHFNELVFLSHITH